MVLLLLPPDGLQARTRKGDKLYKLGVQAEAHKEYDKALEYFQQAEKEDPQGAVVRACHPARAFRVFNGARRGWE